MKKDEFLASRINDVIEVYGKHRNYTPTFAILYEDGTTDSFSTQFHGDQSKENFDFLMREMCSNPKVIACAFACEGWVSKDANKKNRRPSECDDRESVISLFYSIRDNMQEMYVYKPDNNGKLECIYVTNEHQGRFANPFLSPCLTSVEYTERIDSFQQAVRNSLCQTYEQFHEMQNFLFVLSDKKGDVGVQHITDEEWVNKKNLIKMIKSRYQKPQTLAFILIYTENDMVNVLLVSELRKELFCYSIDHPTSTLKLRSVEPYEGDFSGLIKEPNIIFPESRQDQSPIS